MRDMVSSFLSIGALDIRIRKREKRIVKLAGLASGSFHFITAPAQKGQHTLARIENTEHLSHNPVISHAKSGTAAVNCPESVNHLNFIDSFREHF